MINYINYGGADGITGACHMIKTKNSKVLLDCGFFQGRDRKYYSNFDLYFDPKDIDAIILSHAHIDHCGRIPLLYQFGYRGRVYGTKATKLLSEILLHESYKIFNDSCRDNSYLFNIESIDMFLENYVEINYGETVQIRDDVNITLFDSGHLLGSASILLKINGKTIFYSGDIGKINTPILRDPEQIIGADYVIFESTYGKLDKHDSNDFFDQFREIIVNTLKCGGKCLIPSATVGKMQEILYLINDIFEEYKFNYKVYIDSPMSSKILDIYHQCHEFYDDEAKERLYNGDDPLDFETLHYVNTKEESIRIQDIDEPYVVLSGGKMCEGGRIIYHIRKQIENPDNSIILIGNQLKGTLGWKLVNGFKTIDIFKNRFEVNAKIYNFPSLSGHGDGDYLVDYINSMKMKPRKIFLVHGDRKSQIHLGERLDVDVVKYTEFLEEYLLE